ncbi:hypothetical protein BpHYR1_015498 [Brachionus plicatilis]|uniref:Uncharacterized protein n=1 Tax=Brachionus plicatilis TaxID=10195 RepID=A0A3M7RA96_BRAPC|nr:hypothetical protein BpHYR1_015498 [Brachionus plicatilis]
MKASNLQIAFLEINYLTQHVLEPTIKGNILDLVLTDDPARMFRVSHGPISHPSIRRSYEMRSNTRVSAFRFPRHNQMKLQRIEECRQFFSVEPSGGPCDTLNILAGSSVRTRSSILPLIVGSNTCWVSKADYAVVAEPGLCDHNYMLEVVGLDY